MELTVRLRALLFVLTPFEKAMNFDILNLWKWQIFSCDIKHEDGAVLGGRAPGVLIDSASHALLNGSSDGLAYRSRRKQDNASQLNPTHVGRTNLVGNR